MSKTPRTDDQVARYYDDATGRRIEYVPASFARQLERELGQCNDRHAKLIITWSKELAKTQEERDRLMTLLRSEKITRHHNP